MILHCLLLSALAAGATAMLGCGCPSIPLPCPPPQLPLCPPLPPPCPPPRLCPPTFCPPPPICPPPLPPPPPPLCPPPPPPPMCPSYQPEPYTAVPPQNDCCCRCGNPCQYRARTRMHGARIFSSKTVEMEDDPTCNDVKLKTIMQENLTKDATEAKRSIQRAVEEKFSAKFNVICANGDFSYVAYTETYCQTSNDDVTCYAFKPL